MDQQTMTRARSVAASPVDDQTYNVLQALTSKLEAIDAYARYAQGDETGLFKELIEDERRHAEQLLGELRACLATR
jgi:hypothetical protein